MDCLRYWVTGMHVDGFRFDLASVMARDKQGQTLSDPPILWEIESDPILAGTKIIAEAWDAAGLYQVGSFIGHRWAEWNGQYRDDIRRFIKGDNNTVVNAASRISGSRDLYPQPDREPNRSINFVTCHDGFTLNDLVSYNQKHNEANGMKNQDGTDENDSWNCGIEGITQNPDVDAIRERQIRNLLTILLISQGTPMLLMGDEVRRTQSGNNNPFCQNNEISWFDWEGLSRNPSLLRFVKELIRFRMKHSIFHEESYWTEPGGPEVIWHGINPYQPDWGSHSHSLALEITCPELPEHIYVALNAFWEPLTFTLPKPQSQESWQRVVDTALPPPEDICDPPVKMVHQETYLVQPRSVVLLKESRTGRHLTVER